MSNRYQQLLEQLDQRILVLDGEMGTMVQALSLDEVAVRGELFAITIRT